MGEVSCFLSFAVGANVDIVCLRALLVLVPVEEMVSPP